MKSLALVVVVFGALTGSVRGDAAPPFFRELNNRGATSVRFDNLAEYPSFTFYLKYQQRISGAPSTHEVRVRSGEVIEKEGIMEMYLLAVPHGQAAALSAKPITEPPSNCLKSERLQDASTGAGYVVPYRVRIEDGKLEVDVQSSEWLPGEWSLWWLERLLYIAVPIALCAALGWFGLRLARRVFRAKPVEPRP